MVYIDGPNRNRWFTELENGGSFHGELLVITRWYDGNKHPIFNERETNVFPGW